MKRKLFEMLLIMFDFQCVLSDLMFVPLRFYPGGISQRAAHDNG